MHINYLTICHRILDYVTLLEVSMHSHRADEELTSGSKEIRSEKLRQCEHEYVGLTSVLQGSHSLEKSLSFRGSP